MAPQSGDSRLSSVRVPSQLVPRMITNSRYIAAGPMSSIAVAKNDCQAKRQSEISLIETYLAMMTAAS